MQIAIWIAGIIVGLFALDRLALWAEAKGWIYWRKVKRKGSGGAALMTFNAVFDPSAHKAIEAREEQQQEDEDDGDDDAKREPDDRVS
jgi:hypothetical protein